MADDFMHIIDGKAVTKYDLGSMFVHVQSITGEAALCKLTGFSDFTGADVYVQYYNAKSITHTNWSAPVLVKAKELHWYKKPNFTAEDLLK